MHIHFSLLYLLALSFIRLLCCYLYAHWILSVCWILSRALSLCFPLELSVCFSNCFIILLLFIHCVINLPSYYLRFIVLRSLLHLIRCILSFFSVLFILVRHVNLLDMRCVISVRYLFAGVIHLHLSFLFARHVKWAGTLYALSIYLCNWCATLVRAHRRCKRPPEWWTLETDLQIIHVFTNRDRPVKCMSVGPPLQMFRNHQKEADCIGKRCPLEGSVGPLRDLTGDPYLWMDFHWAWNCVDVFREILPL